MPCDDCSRVHSKLESQKECLSVIVNTLEYERQSNKNRLDYQDTILRHVLQICTRLAEYHGLDAVTNNKSSPKSTLSNAPTPAIGLVSDYHLTCPAALEDDFLAKDSQGIKKESADEILVQYETENAAGNSTVPVHPAFVEHNWALKEVDELFWSTDAPQNTETEAEISANNQDISAGVEMDFSNIDDQCMQQTPTFTAIAEKSPTTVSEIRAKRGRPRPHKCEMCDKAFQCKTDLERHIMTHTGQRPFKCSYCDYSSITKGHLNAHLRLHTGEKPYHCQYCGQRFRNLRSCKTHVSRKHRVDAGCLVCSRLECPVCCRVFERGGNVHRHFLIAHNKEKPFPCTTCGRWFGEAPGTRRNSED